MLKIEVDNRNGRLWDVTAMVPELSWKTSRIGKAGTLDFQIVRNRSLELTEQLPLACGNVVRVWHGDRRLFYGYIFTLDEGRDRVISVKAQDQLRYLLETDTYVKANVTAAQVIKDQAMAIKGRLGPIADTSHAIPKFSQDGQKRLDMIFKALDETMMAKGTMFVFYDEAGYMTLRNVLDMKAEILVGDNSLLYGYSYSRSIDSETYNRIKLVRDNKGTGRRDVYIEQDSASIARWGQLQFYQKVDEKLNEEQIKEMSHRLMLLKNREQRKFSLEALGHPGIRAGSVVQVTVERLGLNRNFLVEDCTHNYKGGEHTMQLELRVFDGLIKE
ncbi:hypothetical protein M3223_11760 [Paenibacillus pasadenensis]|uniref:XkdQ/YqbQ family protein n=1 Tax=Paenibacillus pasadenensis TaxID=217090 RepID=UPI002040CD11|nr:hypothetical protein [Paenibacillus pasadenensis]MCM3748028.1 hypothetical protein [Paenibacillus pasadenensis]